MCREPRNLCTIGEQPNDSRSIKGSYEKLNHEIDGPANRKLCTNFDGNFGNFIVQKVHKSLHAMNNFQFSFDGYYQFIADL